MSNCRPIPAALDELMAAWNRSDAPGGVLAVRHRGRLLAHCAAGLASIETGAVLQAGSSLPIGSITKQFTCAALLLLETDGVLGLDDPVGRWLPELPPVQQAPSLRQLMMHTGGVRCFLDQWMFDGYRTMTVGVPWMTQCRQRTANFLPGAGSSYSNGGYLLLTRVIERASGQTLGRFLQQRLFAPLGMFATALPGSDTPLEPSGDTYMRTSDQGGHSGWQPALAMSEERFGDGGMVSTAADLLRWAAYLRQSNGAVRLERMAPPSRVDDGCRYGFGLISQSWRGRRLIQHAGGLPGANSALLMLPDDELDVVVLCNHSAPATDIALRAAEIALDEQLSPAFPPPLARDHARLSGHYLAQETGLLLGFTDMGGMLSLSLFGDAPFPLEGCATQGVDLPFRADVGTGDIRFRVPARDDGAQARAIEYFDGVCWYRAERIEAAQCDVGDFVAQVPQAFHSEDAAATMNFEDDSGQLVLCFRGEHGSGRYHADILSPDLVRFRSSQFPSSKLARLIRSGPEVMAVIVSTSRTRATIFTRHDVS